MGCLSVAINLSLEKKVSMYAVSRGGGTMSDSDLLRRLETVGEPPDKWILVYNNNFKEIVS